uniref:Integrase catalytic domain-containing protein n=1 Tax=Fusarium oxysporum (strain Fo5176) TaxID=660025 RepID=A0A0D2XSC0_FUSOF
MAEALKHLVGQCRGVKIREISTVECDACGMAKVKRQVRRQIRVPPEKAGIRLAIDFHDMSGDPGYTSAMLVTDRYSGYIWDYYLPDRTAPTLIGALEHLLRTLERQLQCRPEVIECDNEIPDSHQVSDFLSIKNGMRLEPSAPYAQSQNGGAERSGGVIKEKARAMRAGAKLPSFLWVEIWRAAVYLYNRTPKYIYNWKTPYERFYTYFAFRDGVVVTERKPDQTHLRVYGCTIQDHLVGTPT